MHEWIIIKRATDDFSCIISPSCYWTVWSTREMERRGSKGDKEKNEEKEKEEERKISRQIFMDGKRKGNPEDREDK